MMNSFFRMFVLWLMILLWCTLLSICQAVHIDIVRKPSLRFNGLKITGKNVHEYLDENEKLFIFGGRDPRENVKLVHVFHKSRFKRSIGEKVIHIQIDGEESQKLKLAFQKSNQLIDDNFVYIKRDGNTSILIDDYPRIASRFRDCFYRNINSALDVCDGNIRGMIKQNQHFFIIHPLPERFGTQSHIVYEMRHPLNVSHPPIIEFNQEPGNSSLSEPNVREVKRRMRRRTSATEKIPHVLHIETAIFVDRDLYKHMAINFANDTESQIIRFVLALVNGVQLLYHHPSLGYQINFVLKRLEILHSDPKELKRSSDIDVFLNSFCLWQRKFNPVSDADIVHFDHAVILTGLDLYVVSKNGKVSSQVVGLAPVAGMCTATSSCTINEGKHFESVFVVAHEIGHNLGMRHDTPENNCDPSLYIMSPTLGSGKITWSRCSQNYLTAFLKTHQAKCMFDRGHFAPKLDHSAEGILPGERFDANQQCILKYGKDSVRAVTQDVSEICRDLHCQRERYTWTSHPSLEGTKCGDSRWCRSGMCVSRYSQNVTASQIGTSKHAHQSNSIFDKRYAGIKQEYGGVIWSNWSEPTECESGCLYGESGRLREGSTGLRMYTRKCLDFKLNADKCKEGDKKYEACSSRQCYNIPRTTIVEFANRICERARKFDRDILSEGMQLVGDNLVDSCKVYCRSKSGSKTKGWIFPDGTTCRYSNSDLDGTYYCVNGKCEKFSCDNSSTNFFKTDSLYCPESPEQLQEIGDEVEKINATSLDNSLESGLKSLSIKSKGSSMENESVKRTYPYAGVSSFRNQNNKEPENSIPIKRMDVPFQRPSYANEWIVKSGCHFSCMRYSLGIQIVMSSLDRTTNIQLCKSQTVACDKLQTTTEYADKLCYKYQLKVRGLSGNGMQILPSIKDPDRGCKVACQDEFLLHRFYFVNGEQGFYPFGTRCSSSENRYCVNGKCLKFGLDGIPLNESHLSLAGYRSKRDLFSNRRERRSYLYYSPVNITERVTQDYIQSIIASINFAEDGQEDSLHEGQIDFLNPIHVSLYDYY
ncbi:A disintegrin and metalloproteinase with thrombospondin motifs adt-1 [Bradysia coprophila]|uniref:A disintegrin and metalloproteinase with thrombospondin motifs adt-1 n=1 Tax=Bradysia coprophila TaxID=38358 RepID=UPI00187DB17C|nr:A disintegrin and metalloproteinase with thrombospondin motifs adt-1 [Bradysia coprophila]XP_037036545.1 A disintegrin and metalloproteinase with thrombospondin motifs adt-1 [Bradysia coprophila]